MNDKEIIDYIQNIIRHDVVCLIYAKMGNAYCENCKNQNVDGTNPCCDCNRLIGNDRFELKDYYVKVK